MTAIVTLFVFLFAAREAQAFGFFPRAHVSYNTTFANAVVANPFHRPIICSGFVYGVTSYGHTYNAFMNNQVIYPGMHGTVYVYTNVYDPFINAYSNIQCRWF